jgi:hypothetical protein
MCGSAHKRPYIIFEQRYRHCGGETEVINTLVKAFETCRLLLTSKRAPTVPVT